MQSFEIVAERPLVEARLEFFLPVGKSPHRIEFAKLMSEPPRESFPRARTIGGKFTSKTAVNGYLERGPNQCSRCGQVIL
jgi:hypothetical protein